MAEFSGDADVIAMHKALRDRHGEIAANPYLSNGARIINVMDVEAVGWDAIRALLTEFGMVSLTMVPAAATLDRARAEFGPDFKLMRWNVFTGAAERVLPVCTNVTAAHPLPAGWRHASHTRPDAAVIDAVQRLNSACGVAATPGYYMRGEAVPHLTTCIHDADGVLAACALASRRYHPDGPQAGHLFAGSVSVNPVWRRRGLGRWVNAQALLDAHAALGWTMALEQAAADNPASCAMITGCGLSQVDGAATIAIAPHGKTLTR